MPVTGEGKKGILIIGEASGADEDEHNEQWMGQAGDKLRKALRANKLDLNRDFYKINVKCQNPNINTNPNDK